MKSFHLEILSPERNFYTGECISLVVPISDGMLGIMAGRTPLTAAISDGEVIFTLPDGTRRVCAVADGMVDVSGGAARIVEPVIIDEGVRSLSCDGRCVRIVRDGAALSITLSGGQARLSLDAAASPLYRQVFPALRCVPVVVDLPADASETTLTFSLSE